MSRGWAQSGSDIGGASCDEDYIKLSLEIYRALICASNSYTRWWVLCAIALRPLPPVFSQRVFGKTPVSCHNFHEGTCEGASRNRIISLVLVHKRRIGWGG